MPDVRITLSAGDEYRTFALDAADERAAAARLHRSLAAPLPGSYATGVPVTGTVQTVAERHASVSSRSSAAIFFSSAAGEKISPQAAPREGSDRPAATFGGTRIALLAFPQTRRYHSW